MISFVFGRSFAIESIPITISPDRDKVIFDGKWTFYWEWKRTSLTDLKDHNDVIMELRTAHQGNYIYFFVDDISDTAYTKQGDHAIICFDTKNDKSIKPDSDDYCFISSLGSNNPISLQGNDIGLFNYFKKIPNPKNLTAVSGISDQNDRYSSIPHAGYEFRIPTELVGRSNDYGFYLIVYHAHENRYYSWPENSTGNGLLHISDPSEWGNLVSPDSSLPEFPIPLMIFILPWFLIIFISRYKILKR